MNTPNETWKTVLISLLLAAVTTLAFGSVTGAGFVNIDDPRYISENAAVQRGLSGENVKWAFTTFYFSNWHPLTWLSYMLDCQLFGLNPGAMHATNLSLHVANALLLFLLLKRMTGAFWASGIVATLFAVHPLHVESVAWISERKDVLSTLFWLLTMWAYVEYVRRRCAGWYAGALIFFALGLMSKAMLVTLPFALLLIDFWPLRRIDICKAGLWISLRPLILEKIPLFALAAISSYLTFLAQRRGGALSSFTMLPLGERLENAVVSYARYLGKTFWPADLVVFYPPPPLGWPGLQVAGASLLVIGITAIAVLSLRRLPYLFAGWCWFLGTLVPVIGIVQVGGQSMADRYTYVPHIGLFIAIVWTARELVLARIELYLPAIGVAATTLVALAVLAYQQTACWKDSITLFSHAAGVSRPNAFLLNNLGEALSSRGRTAEAMKTFDAALKVDPHDSSVLGNLGNVLLREGKAEQAIEHYRTALLSKEDSPELHFNLGLALASKGDLHGAVQQFTRALELDPLYLSAYRNLGHAYVELGNAQAAITNYAIVLRLNGSDASTHYDLGTTYVKGGETNAGLEHLQEAIRLKPDYADAHRQLGLVLAAQGNFQAASEHLKATVKLRPQDTMTHLHLADINLQMSETKEAITEYREALRLDPNLVEALNNLAWVNATHPDPKFRDGKQAVELAERACELAKQRAAVLLGTLAAAYAEAGRFEEAAQTAEEAINLAEQNGQKDLVSKNKELLASYRQQRPWREPLKGL